MNRDKKCGSFYAGTERELLILLQSCFIPPSCIMHQTHLKKILQDKECKSYAIKYHVCVFVCVLIVHLM